MTFKPLKDAWPSRDAQRKRGHPKTPVSELERATLAKFRARPIYETHLTPTGSVANDVRTHVEAVREARIAFIAKRLGRPKTRARDDFNHSR